MRSNVPLTAEVFIPNPAARFSLVSVQGLRCLFHLPTRSQSAFAEGHFHFPSEPTRFLTRSRINQHKH
jgi:hypothetical protein